MKLSKIPLHLPGKLKVKLSDKRAVGHQCKPTVWAFQFIMALKRGRSLIFCSFSSILYFLHVSFGGFVDLRVLGSLYYCVQCFEQGVNPRPELSLLFSLHVKASLWRSSWILQQKWKYIFLGLLNIHIAPRWKDLSSRKPQTTHTSIALGIVDTSFSRDKKNWLETKDARLT